MQTFRLIRSLEIFPLAYCVLVASASAVFGQSNTIPTVVIYATTPNATFDGKPGTISVFRQGNPTPALDVYCCISGTASNGIDYQTISNFISLPSGVNSNSFIINLINNGQTNIETVNIDLCPSPMVPPVNYTIGSPSNAVVFIYPASNAPPVVRIFSPTNGAIYQAPVNIPLFAQASDPDGTIANVEFFAGTTDLGPGQQLVLDPPGVNGVTGPVFYLNWSNVPPNTYSLTAVATDNGGASTVSAAINISVLGAGGNVPPIISMVYPTNGTVFHAPSNVPLYARASDPDGTVSNIEFFAGSMDLGPGQPVSVTSQGTLFYLTWSNVPPNAYSLTAVATDNGGASTVSAAVGISVLGSGSNAPSVVSITSPTNGAVFHAPVNIPLYAQASDPDGTVSNVEFFAGAADLGSGQVVSADIRGTVFYLNWSNVPPNTYSLTAVATDDGGASTVSATVNISVLGAGSNLPSVVRITSPPNGAVFHAPMNVPIISYAADFNGYVTSVQFFADGNSLGFGHKITATTWSPSAVSYISPSNLWFFVWTNPPPETNIMLTALATDNGSLATTSAPVVISILPPVPPPTNRPPFVGIVASDPVAIEGTNCWPWITLAGETTYCTWSNWTSATAIFCRITNCGPKDATFTVFRVGATNEDLNVGYSIGGTATNGVDYVTLPGTVLIPAGQRSASVTVVPLDDGVPDITSIVVLKVAPGTNYLVGFPSAAGAIILDSGSPLPVAGMLPGSFFHLCANGPNGAWFHVEHSLDLVNWTPICTNQVVNGSIDFVDPNAAVDSGGFYRIVPEISTPEP